MLVFRKPQSEKRDQRVAWPKPSPDERQLVSEETGSKGLRGSQPWFPSMQTPCQRSTVWPCGVAEDITPFPYSMTLIILTTLKSRWPCSFSPFKSVCCGVFPLEYFDSYLSVALQSCNSELPFNVLMFQAISHPGQALSKPDPVSGQGTA